MLWAAMKRVFHRLLVLLGGSIEVKMHSDDWHLGLREELKYTLAVSLLQKLCRAEQGKNFVFSPLSLGAALAMLTAGLKGDAKCELLRFFGAVDGSELHSMFSALLLKENLPLKMANKCLADNERIEVRLQFESLLKETYKSEIECVNFGSDSRRIEKDVNAWVSKKTEDMITELLPEGTLHGDVILVILNAIYFKGSWFEEFHPDLRPRTFELRNGKPIRRHFIAKQSSELAYAETKKTRLVKIPYKEAGFYMLVVMPKNEDDHIDEIIVDMQLTELIKAIKNSKDEQDVRISMPKFKIEYTFESVEQCMKDLGVEKIFVPGDADFGDVFVTEPGSTFVERIIHKAVIEVDEEGTRAAAATEIQCVTRCAGSRPFVSVTVNRPFLYMVMSEDDLICFAGICAHPREEQ